MLLIGVVCSEVSISSTKDNVTQSIIKSLGSSNNSFTSFNSVGNWCTSIMGSNWTDLLERLPIFIIFFQNFIDFEIRALYKNILEKNMLMNTSKRFNGGKYGKKKLTSKYEVLSDFFQHTSIWVKKKNECELNIKYIEIHGF